MQADRKAKDIKVKKKLQNQSGRKKMISDADKMLSEGLKNLNKGTITPDGKTFKLPDDVISIQSESLRSINQNQVSAINSYFDKKGKVEKVVHKVAKVKRAIVKKVSNKAKQVSRRKNVRLGY